MILLFILKALVQKMEIYESIGEKLIELDTSQKSHFP